MYTHGCIYNNLSFIVGWSNTLKGVNTYRVPRYTLKEAQLSSINQFYFNNFVTKHFNNNKDIFLGKILTVNGVCNSDL